MNEKKGKEKRKIKRCVCLGDGFNNTNPKRIKIKLLSRKKKTIGIPVAQRKQPKCM